MSVDPSIARIRQRQERLQARIQRLERLADPADSILEDEIDDGILESTALVTLDGEVFAGTEHYLTEVQPDLPTDIPVGKLAALLTGLGSAGALALLSRLGRGVRAPFRASKAQASQVSKESPSGDVHVDEGLRQFVDALESSSLKNDSKLLPRLDRLVRLHVALEKREPALRTRVSETHIDLVIEHLATEEYEKAEDQVEADFSELNGIEAVEYLDVVNEVLPALPYDTQRDLNALLPPTSDGDPKGIGKRRKRLKTRAEQADAWRAHIDSGKALSKKKRDASGRFVRKGPPPKAAERSRKTPTPSEKPPTVSMFDAAPADLYAKAAQEGMINENQYNGLGHVTVEPGKTADLRDCINRNIWGKSLVLDADDTANIMVMSITVAGLPVNVGTQGTPLSMFATNSTRFGVSFGRKLCLTGQNIVVTVQNIGTKPITVSGGLICDEMNPYAMQKWMEQMLLTAATSGFVDGGGLASVADETPEGGDSDEYADEDYPAGTLDADGTPDDGSDEFVDEDLPGAVEELLNELSDTTGVSHVTLDALEEAIERFREHMDTQAAEEANADDSEDDDV